MDDKLFHKSLQLVGNVMAQVKQEDLQKPTPCTEWDVHALINHLLNETAWVEPLLAGKTIDEVGSALDGNLAGDDPLSAWQKYSKNAGSAVMETAPDKLVHLSYADKSAEAYIKEVAADIIIHGWDLAQSLSTDYEIDEATAIAVLDAMKDILPMARDAGFIGKKVEIAEDASPADKLLAVFGRSDGWRQSA